MKNNNRIELNEDLLKKFEMDSWFSNLNVNANGSRITFKTKDKNDKNDNLSISFSLSYKHDDLSVDVSSYRNCIDIKNLKAIKKEINEKFSSISTFAHNMENKNFEIKNMLFFDDTNNNQLEYSNSTIHKNRLYFNHSFEVSLTTINNNNMEKEHFDKYSEAYPYFSSRFVVYLNILHSKYNTELKKISDQKLDFEDFLFLYENFILENEYIDEIKLEVLGFNSDNYNEALYPDYPSVNFFTNNFNSLVFENGKITKENKQFLLDNKGI